MKLQLFISYCHQDVAPDRERLRLFIESLQQASHQSYEILVDYRHPDAGIGADIEAYMRKIDTADAVLLLLTPSYKERVALKGNTGVYVEFKRIYDRFLQADAARTYGRSFLLLPIIFIGDHSVSCPEEIRHLRSEDLTWFHVIPDRHSARRRSKAGEAPIRPQVQERLRRVVPDLVERIAAIGHTKGRGYLERSDLLFRDFLFKDTKSRWDRLENRATYLDQLFVKTSVFLKIRDGDVRFVVGRKGEGKSTVAHVLPAMLDAHPRHMLQIDFDALPFDACYSILSEKPAQASDIRHAFSTLYSYQLVWDVFLHLFLAFVVRNDLPKRGRPAQIIRRLCARPHDANSQTLSRSFFVYAFERLFDFTNHLLLSKARGTSIATAVSSFTPGAFRAFVFGEPGWKSVSEALNLFSDRLVITVDGFDVMIDYFRTASENPADASRFEREILLALIQIILNSGPSSVPASRLYEVSRFCATIPYDRFLEVRAHHRDRYQFRHQFARLEWSGLELSALVRKRLAAWKGVKDSSGPSLPNRFDKVMRACPNLPTDLAFQFGQQQYRLPLFCYVLRHTFWRPRDVLFFYAKLLAAAEPSKKRGELLSTGFIRQVIAGCTTPVVEDEFLQEFKTTFANVQAVINRFRHRPQVLSFEDVRSAVDEVPFEIYQGGRKDSSLEWKLELLFELGFLGVQLDRKQAEQLNSHRHAFSFSEGHLLKERMDRSEYPKLSFLIHPIFTEYLHVDTSGNDELTFAFDWEYLERNERLRGLGPNG